MLEINCLILLESLSERIATAKSVMAIIDDVRSTYALDHVTYHLVRNLSDGVDSPYVRTTYPPEWVGEYVMRQYVDRDPIIKAGIGRVAPFDWASLNAQPFFDDIMKAAARHGIGRNGYSVPIVDKRGRRALISFNSAKPDEIWRNHIEAYSGHWIEIAQQVHRKALIEAFGTSDPLPQLGPRELECLTLTAQGKEAKEIAIALRISEHTVRTYLKSARYKLGCATQTQAVSKALRYHLISP